MLFLSILLPALGAAALFLWRPADRRSCHSLTMGVTLLTSLCAAWCILPPGDHAATMMRLTPELNQLKMKFYGDRDTIADETQLLYKREKYHPLASTIPMFIQLILLIGVIGAVKLVLGGADSVLTVLPSEAGGWTWIMPLAAGAGALAL